MSRPKGTRNAATLRRMETAEESLRLAREKETALQRELDERLAIIEAERRRVSSLRASLRHQRLQISRFEALAAERQELEKQSRELDGIRALVEKLIANGMTAEDIREKAGLTKG